MLPKAANLFSGLKEPCACGNIYFMNTVVNEKAYAKLNISLDVSCPREDGYHDMEMVMQAVSLCDDVSLHPAEPGTVRAEMSLPYIPGDERNLAVKAARNFLAEAGKEDAGFIIRIKKRIPVGAGMAGGSTDAAAVIRALNAFYGGVLSRERLMAVAEKTGSDVAFCVLGGTALARGRGEILTELPPLPQCSILICKPKFSVSTPELFKAIDSVKLRVHPDTRGIVSALEEGSLCGVCRRMYNVFEDVPDRRMKTVSEIRSKLMESGASGAIMTGTGSAVFGIFEDEELCRALVPGLKKEYGFACTAKPVGTLI